MQLSGDLLVQLADIFGVSTDYILGRTKYRTYEGTSFEVPKIIDLLSRGDMEMISNWAELSPENQARIADYAKILQKAEAAQHFFCRVSLFSPVPAVLVRNLVQHQKHNSKQKFLIPPLVRKRIYLQQNKI